MRLLKAARTVTVAGGGAACPKYGTSFQVLSRVVWECLAGSAASLIHSDWAGVPAGKRSVGSWRSPECALGKR